MFVTVTTARGLHVLKALSGGEAPRCYGTYLWSAHTGSDATWHSIPDKADGPRRPNKGSPTIYTQGPNRQRMLRKPLSLLTFSFFGVEKLPNRQQTTLNGHKLHSDLDQSICTSRASACVLSTSPTLGTQGAWGQKEMSPGHSAPRLMAAAPNHTTATVFTALSPWGSWRSHARNSTVAFPSLTTSQSCQFICSPDFLLSKYSLPFSHKVPLFTFNPWR